MFPFLAALLLASALYYAALLGVFARGFRRVFSGKKSSASPSPEPDADVPFVSVVVAARDEAGHIERCLDAILASDYPAGRFEVIVVDDFSRDDTAQRVRRLIAERRRVPAGTGSKDGIEKTGPASHTLSDREPRGAPEVRLLQMHRVMAESTGHKREALNHGISAARGPLILTTDADCTPAPGWIGAMTGPMRSGGDVAFVAGPVRYRLGGDDGGGAQQESFVRRLFDKAQALEFLALQAVGAGAIGLGRPAICNSANVAYRQRTYEALYRSETLGAADDETLIQRIARETDQRVAFCPDEAARVETPPADGPRAFLRQRQRWASMTPRYPDTGFTLAMGGLYGFYLMLLVAAGALFWVPALAGPLAAALGLKVAAEAALLGPACRRFGQPGLLRALVPFQPLHIGYVAFIGAAGPLGTTRWKGRTVD